MWKHFRSTFIPVLIALVGLTGVSAAMTEAFDEGSPSDEIVLESNTSETEEVEEPEDVDVENESEENDDADEAKEPKEPKTPKEKKARSTEGCPEGFTGNHGQFVSGSDEGSRSDAAHSDCGKPAKPEKAEKQDKPKKDKKPKPRDEKNGD